MDKIPFIILIITLSVLVLKMWYSAFRKRRLQKKRFKRGAKLEKQAARFLIKKGFKILGEQVEFEHKYKVGHSYKISKLNIDYLVSKNSKIYIVEVKSGNSAISIANKSTRRQLLEYSIAIPNDGVFLLDMENKDLQLIVFNDINQNRNSTAVNNYFLLAIMIGTIGYYLFTFLKA